MIRTATSLISSAVVPPGAAGEHRAEAAVVDDADDQLDALGRHRLHDQARRASWPARVDRRLDLQRARCGPRRRRPGRAARRRRRSCARARSPSPSARRRRRARPRAWTASSASATTRVATQRQPVAVQQLRDAAPARASPIRRPAPSLMIAAASLRAGVGELRARARCGRARQRRGARRARPRGPRPRGTRTPGTWTSPRAQLGGRALAGHEHRGDRDLRATSRAASRIARATSACLRSRAAARRSRGSRRTRRLRPATSIVRR